MAISIIGRAVGGPDGSYGCLATQTNAQLEEQVVKSMTKVGSETPGGEASQRVILALKVQKMIQRHTKRPLNGERRQTADQHHNWRLF